MASTKTTTLNCFSPPVMLATFIIESLMAIYTIWRYRLNTISRIVTLMLMMLGLFQLSEYYDCTGLGINAADWSRVGYITITTLPPLGLHLLHSLAGKKQRNLVKLAYASMVGFIATFIFASNIFRGYQCTGNYVIFQLNIGPAIAYSTYYYFWLASAIYLSFKWSARMWHGEMIENAKTVRAIAVGYMVFLVPTALTNTVTPASRRGIPSIMCGFAVLFAIILSFYILPRSGEPRRQAIDKQSE